MLPLFLTWVRHLIEVQSVGLCNTKSLMMISTSNDVLIFTRLNVEVKRSCRINLISRVSNDLFH